jgi:hypothetical protein
MSKILENPINTYNALVEICELAKAMSLKNPDKYVGRFKLPIGAEKSKDVKRDIKEYFDGLQKQLENTFFLNLVATFESVVFDKVNNASGEMKKTLREEYEDEKPFSKFSGEFVKSPDDIRGLGTIREIVSRKLTKKLKDDISGIIKYRDHLAHGERFNPKYTFAKLEDVQYVLEKVLGVM